MSSALNFMEELVGPTTIGMLLRAYRTRNNLSQKELGKIIKQTVSYVSDLERDKKPISLLQIKEIAQRLGESVGLYAKVWIKQELSEANIDAEVDIKPIKGDRSLFARARNAVLKHKSPVHKHLNGTAKKATRKKTS